MDLLLGLLKGLYENYLAGACLRFEERFDESY